MTGNAGIGRLDLPVRPTATGALPLSPTDVAQFIRLEQCQRYLRLRLHERSVNRNFLYEYNVAPQRIAPLLTRSGAVFEQQIEQQLQGYAPTVNLLTDRPAQGWVANNDDILAAIAALLPGQQLILLQPRVQVAVAGWLLRGDIDILRLERDADGTLQIMIVDMKSSLRVKVEHRLQVAFYHTMLTGLLAEAGILHAPIVLGILYRGPDPAAPASPHVPATLAMQQAQEAMQARDWFGVTTAYLEIPPSPTAYLVAVDDLVTGPHSLARQAAVAPFADLPYHLTARCDGCLYNEFCLKWSAEQDDLSLVPFITAAEKGVLRQAGITTTRQLALLKEFPDDDSSDLVAAPGQEALVQQLSATWPIGPHLDELIHRARAYRRSAKDDLRRLSYIPNQGYGSLPYVAAEQNPNLIYVYIDAQHDYLLDRLYLIGAHVVACGEGMPVAEETIVRLAPAPPEKAEDEAALLLDWIAATMQAILSLAVPDAKGEPSAPIHLVFWNSYTQKIVLEALARHVAAVLGAAPLYDFLTQIAAFDSPLIAYLDQEIRLMKNYPLVGQSLQAVASLLRFDWDTPEPYRTLFRARLFDARGRLERHDDSTPWIVARARFDSQIPLEYAYAAWGDLADPSQPDQDFASYRNATPERLVGLTSRRLAALVLIAQQFPGNRQTTKTPFRLPDLATWRGTARSLADALDEFMQIERLAMLTSWQETRRLAPEQRVLAGESLLVTYQEADQEPALAAANREHLERQARYRQLVQAFLATQPAPGAKLKLTKEEQQATKWSHEGQQFWLSIDCTNVDCDLEHALAISNLREGDSLILSPRWEVDGRLSPDEQEPFTPTPKQMLYDQRVQLERLDIARDEAGQAVTARALVKMSPPLGGDWSRGFVFRGFPAPLEPGTTYTLDPDPNEWYGYWCAMVTAGLRQGGRNTLYQRLVQPATAHVSWLPAASAGQAQFLAGLVALERAGLLHGFESGKHEFIGATGEVPTLLVQGPPGTGKSYSTAFAVFARLQGALAAGQPYRVVLACKTHAATDLLLENVAQVQELLRGFSVTQPDLFQRFFDDRLLDVPLLRVRPRRQPPAGVQPLWGERDAEKVPDSPKMAKAILSEQYVVIGATPGGIYNVLKEAGRKSIFGHDLCQCLILDEASQMNLPEACMAALPLVADGHLIVVGDHRQMPPIVRHRWAAEPRRTFSAFRTYESLFNWLRALQVPMIQFAESFRLHEQMAAFLRRAVYEQDGIAYHSRRQGLLAAVATHDDPLVAAALAPAYPLVVIVHDEAASQQRNVFERDLVAPILDALVDPATYGLDTATGLGVVVPHRAQRAELQAQVPALSVIDPDTGVRLRSAVDTVERFQGGERAVIVVSATESDREYLLKTGDFLLDPRRLTVALSRAQRKLILVASRSVFDFFSADDETFANAQLWKSLLRETCTVQLWHGERAGQQVEVWGNASQPAAGGV